MPRRRSVLPRWPSLRGSRVPQAIDALEATAREWKARAERMAAALDLMRRRVREAEEAAGWVSPRGPGRPPGSRSQPGKAKAAKPARAKAKTRSGPRPPRGRSVGDQALELLRAHGKPMGVQELLVALARIGVKVGGQRPSNTLTATMSRAKGVRRAGPGRYEAEVGSRAP